MRRSMQSEVATPHSVLRKVAREALVEALNCPWLDEQDMVDILAQHDFIPRGEYDAYDTDLDEEQE